MISENNDKKVYGEMQTTDIKNVSHVDIIVPIFPLENSSMEKLVKKEVFDFFPNVKSVEVRVGNSSSIFCILTCFVKDKGPVIDVRQWEDELSDKIVSALQDFSYDENSK